MVSPPPASANPRTKVEGARFEFTFDKVQAKIPQHDKFTALLRPDENGQLQLYYDTLKSNLDDYFFVFLVRKVTYLNTKSQNI